jgi:hypothetical protein
MESPAYRSKRMFVWSMVKRPSAANAPKVCAGPASVDWCDAGIDDSIPPDDRLRGAHRDHRTLGKPSPGIMSVYSNLAGTTF